MVCNLPPWLSLGPCRQGPPPSLREEQAQGLQPFGSRSWYLQLASMAVTWRLQVKSALEAAAPMREELQRRGVFVVPLPIYASPNNTEDAAVEIPAPGPEVGVALVARCGGVGFGDGDVGCRLCTVGCRSPRLRACARGRALGRGGSGGVGCWRCLAGGENPALERMQMCNAIALASSAAANMR